MPTSRVAGNFMTIWPTASLAKRIDTIAIISVPMLEDFFLLRFLSLNRIVEKNIRD